MNGAAIRIGHLTHGHKRQCIRIDRLSKEEGELVFIQAVTEWAQRSIDNDGTYTTPSDVLEGMRQHGFSAQAGHLVDLMIQYCQYRRIGNGWRIAVA